MYKIDDNPFSINLISKLISNKTKLALSKNSIDKIVSCRDYLNNKIESSKSPIYGINTGIIQPNGPTSRPSYNFLKDRLSEYGTGYVLIHGNIAPIVGNVLDN